MELTEQRVDMKHTQPCSRVIVVRTLCGSLCVCVRDIHAHNCVCVCVCMRERERDRQTDRDSVFWPPDGTPQCRNYACLCRTPSAIKGSDFKTWDRQNIALYTSPTAKNSFFVFVASCVSLKIKSQNVGLNSDADFTPDIMNRVMINFFFF